MNTTRNTISVPIAPDKPKVCTGGMSTHSRLSSPAPVVSTLNRPGLKVSESARAMRCRRGSSAMRARWMAA
jgi:hypothetical protein